MKTTATIMTTSLKAGMVGTAQMTKRQEYWMHLRTIHSATGQWNRRLTFLQAAEWVLSYTYDRTTGYPTEHAAQRAYDVILNPKRKEWALV